MYNYICVCRYVFGVLQKSRQNISKSENVDDYVSVFFFKKAFHWFQQEKFQQMKQNCTL